MATAAPRCNPSRKKNMKVFWHFCFSELIREAYDEGETTEEKKRSHGTCQVDVKSATISGWQTVAWCISSFKWPKCVQQLLSDWTHVFHRDESVPFLLVTSASSCPVRMTSDGVAQGEQLSPLRTHSRLSCDHVCGGLCGRAREGVYDELKGMKGFFCFYFFSLRPLPCACHGMSTWTYGLRGMEAVRRSVRRISVQGQSVNGGLLGHFTFMVSLFRCEEEHFTLSPTLTDKYSTSFLSSWNKSHHDGNQSQSPFKGVLSASL